MFRTLRFLIVAWLTLLSSLSYARPELKFPFPGGESWRLTQGNDTGTHTGTDRYSIDLAADNCGSVGRPILAAAAGIVEIGPYSGNAYGNNVYVDHGDGWRTRYVHLKSISVVTGQYVMQGQKLGITGNTGFYYPSTSCGSDSGTHLHFMLYHNGVNVPLEPISGKTKLTEWQVYTSDNYERHYNFIDNSSNAYTCTDPPIGGEATNWVYSCNDHETIFYEGEDVFSVIRLTQISQNITFRVEAWRVGELNYAWAWQEPTERQVEPNVWGYTYFNPEFRDVWAGDWELRTFADTGDGFLPLTTLSFIVQGGNQQYPGYPYQYNGNAYHCKDGVTGGANTNWVYTCNNPEQVYQQGNTVWSLFRIDNVATSHRFRARTFRNGQQISSWTQDGWNEVPSGQMWTYAYAWNQTQANVPGNYEVHYDVEKKFDFYFPIDYDVGIVSFTVNAGPPYTYDGNVTRCANAPTGGESTNWVYTCPGSKTTFNTSEAIRVLVHVNNITVSHKWRGRFFHNGSPTPYAIDQTGWNVIPAGQAWGSAYTWPTLWYPPSGSWKATIDIDIGNGWQVLKDNITFTVAANPAGSYPYNGGMEFCKGYYENERDGTGVPQCWDKVWGNQVQSWSRYYWRIPVTGLISTYNFRVEMYRGTTLDWSWDFGPYPTPSGGTGWFFPEFNLPPSGSWRAVFYVKTGTTWQYLNEFAFTSQ